MATRGRVLLATLTLGMVAAVGLTVGSVAGRQILGHHEPRTKGLAIGDADVDVPSTWVRTVGPGFAFSTPTRPAVSYGAVPASGLAVASPGYQATVDGLVFNAARGALPSPRGEVDDQLDGVARTVAVASAGTIEGRRRIRTPAGDALDYAVDLPDGRHLHGRVVIAGGDAFTFSVVAAGGEAPPSYAAFLASATISG